jgi:hypothetical protein
MWWLCRLGTTCIAFNAEQTAALSHLSFHIQRDLLAEQSDFVDCIATGGTLALFGSLVGLISPVGHDVVADIVHVGRLGCR